MPGKPRFRRSDVWVVVRPIRRTSREFIPIGTEIAASEFRRHHLFALWRRNRIGPKGHPWTEYLVARRRLKDGIPPTPVADEGLDIENLGGGWYRMSKDGAELAKVQGTDAANRWLEEHGYKPMA